MNQETEAADDFAQIGEEPAKATPPELKDVAAKAEAAPKASGINQFDGTVHHPNGARYFPNGNKVDGVNSWVLAQEEPAAPVAPAKTDAAAPATPAKTVAAAPATPAKAVAAAPATPDAPLKDAAPADAATPAKAGAADAGAKNLNPFDGTEHKNGTRFFPDGNAVAGVNLNLGQAEPTKANATAEAAPEKANATAKAEPTKANATAKAVKADAVEVKGPTSPVNEFDGTVHAEGDRFFPDGKKVGGVNLRLQQAPSLRLTQIPKIRSFAQIIQPASNAVNEKDKEPEVVGEPKLGVNPEKAPEPVKKLNPWTGLYHNEDGSRDFSTGGKVGGVNNWI